MRFVGFPALGGETLTTIRGIISGTRVIDGVTWIKTDAGISGGNSGGAALDADGFLVGVPTMYSSTEDGELVDCRPGADTNGDGTIDERDGCQSVGGTLSLLSPVAEVEALLRRAGIPVVFGTPG